MYSYPHLTIGKERHSKVEQVTQLVNSELSLMLGRYFVYLVLFCFKSAKSLPVGSGDNTMSYL